MDAKEVLLPQPSIEIIYAGGTISSLATDDGYREGGHAVDLVQRLQDHAPDFSLAGTIGEKQIAYTGLSENMTFQDQEVILEKVVSALSRKPHSIVVTHGTDTMEQTARLLDLILGSRLENEQSRIILTGANDDLEAEGTDAWDNLEFSLASAASDIPPGVYVAFHGRLIPASEVVKLPFVEGGEVTFISSFDPLYRDSLRTQEAHSAELIEALHSKYDRHPENTGVIEFDANVIRTSVHSLAAQIRLSGARAVLLKLYHSGTANTETPGQSISQAVETLSKQFGIVFFGVTENGEAVDLHDYETSVRLREAGVVPLYDMPHDVALMKLQLANSSLTGTKLIDEMLTNQVGEIDESLINSEDIERLKAHYDSTTFQRDTVRPTYLRSLFTGH